MTYRQLLSAVAGLAFLFAAAAGVIASQDWASTPANLMAGHDLAAPDHESFRGYDPTAES